MTDHFSSLPTIMTLLLTVRLLSSSDRSYFHHQSASKQYQPNACWEEHGNNCLTCSCLISRKHFFNLFGSRTIVTSSFLSYTTPVSSGLLSTLAFCKVSTARPLSSLDSPLLDVYLLTRNAGVRSTAPAGLCKPRGAASRTMPRLPGLSSLAVLVASPGTPVADP